ncbi:MAG: 50S ribosomal protein L5 [Bacteriovoracaceae bacterium]
MAKLYDLYKKEVAKSLKEEFGYKNLMEVPKVVKITVNAGVGRASKEAKELEEVIKGLSLITGQRPVKTKAKSSIAGFKIRQGMEVGAMVTLRGKRMYEFLERLISVALPRVRDFRGVSATAFDNNGNYSLGIKDNTIFPENPYEKFSHPFSLQVNITTTAKTDDEARKLLGSFGFPFKSN